ncbi:hypothetical protein CI238_02694 [Colletotrichum incanum]|uniref:Uncharacterized protein n=1 Tax=Colletotrichum incanum TaxID=1573173 RepID=A0A161WA54_COLIC|nr:hypothetical protein CI238_02694 [Colletotrichum incanum]
MQLMRIWGSCRDALAFFELSLDCCISSHPTPMDASRTRMAMVPQHAVRLATTSPTSDACRPSDMGPESAGVFRLGGSGMVLRQTGQGVSNGSSPPSSSPVL